MNQPATETSRRPCYCVRRRLEFSASHQLHGYPGDCSRLHGHNWQLEIEVECRQLDAYGMALDFKTLHAEAAAISDSLDHRHLNDLPPFQQELPTAERVAAYFYRQLAQRLNTAERCLRSVTIWETERASVRYSEDTA